MQINEGSHIIELTEEMVASLTTSKRVEQWSDSLSRGLKVRVTKCGAKTFWIDAHRRDAGRVFKRIGRWPAVSVRQARKELEIIKRQPVAPARKQESILSRRQRLALIDHLHCQADATTVRDCILLWLFVRFALKSEVVRMRWDDIDFESGYWHLRKDLTLDLAAGAKELLIRRRQGTESSSPYVFSALSNLRKADFIMFPRRRLLAALLHVGVSVETAKQIAGTRGDASF